MKRFVWPLQKLFDVKLQREQALESELASLAARIAQADAEIATRRNAIQTQLWALDALPVEGRLARQELFMQCVAVEERQIAKLRQRSHELGLTRRKVLAEYLRARQARQTLERLRDESRRKHIYEQEKLEQNQLDEVAQTRHARRLRAARAHEVTP